MPLLPSDDVFKSHGLSDVELLFQISSPAVDVGPSSNPPIHPFHREEWITGQARLNVQDAYPLISSDEKAFPLVRFTFCSSNDHGSMARFRRQAQLLALDSLPNQHGTSKGSRFAHVKEVLAWWEDIHGLWLITEEDGVERVRLVDWWARKMDNYMEDGVIVDKQGGPEVWMIACDILVMLVECLKVS